MMRWCFDKQKYQTKKHSINLYLLTFLCVSDGQCVCVCVCLRFKKTIEDKMNEQEKSCSMLLEISSTPTSIAMQRININMATIKWYT